MLKTVSRPLGGTIAIDYSREGNHVDRTIAPGVDMPSNQWVMTKVTVEDGRGNSYASSYDYSAFGSAGPLSFGSGFYERDEREDLGYGHVHLVRSAVDFQGNSIGDGSQVDTFYMNQDFYRKGFLQAELESDASGKVIRGSTVTYAAPPATLALRTGTFFPAEQERRTLFYEKAAGFSVASVMAAVRAGQPALAPKLKVETLQFDDQGNITDLVDAGDEQLATDDLAFKITYAFDLGQTTSRARARSTGFHPEAQRPSFASGSPPTTQGTGDDRDADEHCLGRQGPGLRDPGHDLQPGVGDLQLHLRHVRQPRDVDRSDRLQAASTPTTRRRRRTGRASMTSRSATSRPRATTCASAPSSSRATSTASPRASPTTVRPPLHGPRPRRSDREREPTIAMSYGIIPSSCPNPPPAGSAFPAYAVTRHKDVQHAGDPIDTVAFVDGLGRAIQTKIGSRSRHRQGTAR